MLLVTFGVSLKIFWQHYLYYIMLFIYVFFRFHFCGIIFSYCCNLSIRFENKSWFPNFGFKLFTIWFNKCIPIVVFDPFDIEYIACSSAPWVIGFFMTRLWLKNLWCQKIEEMIAHEAVLTKKVDFKDDQHSSSSSWESMKV